MPTKKKRHYCIKCGNRKVASKTIKIACTRKRYGTDDAFSIHFCHSCSIRFFQFLSGLVKSGALVGTPTGNRPPIQKEGI